MKDLVHNVFVTGACNLACTFCFAENARKADDTTTQKIINQIRHIDAKTVRLCGGEPLFVWDDRTVEIIESIHSGVEIIINSNGRLITEDIINYINEKNLVLQVSIDGFLRGERSLSVLNIGLLKRIHRLWINQILWFPEDTKAINEVLNPEVHEICFERGARNITPPYVTKLLEVIPENVFFGKIDPDCYNEVVTYQTGKTYANSNILDFCTIVKRQIGGLAWLRIRNRKKL